MHRAAPISRTGAANVLAVLFQVLVWAAYTYSTTPDQVPTGESFDPRLAAASAPLSAEEAVRLSQRFREQDERHRAELATRDDAIAAQQEQLAELRRQVRAAQQARTVREAPDHTIVWASEQPGGLGLFIRSLVGLDRAAAMEAFSGLLADRTMTVEQHHFVDMIIDELTANGAMDPGRLFEPPFTDDAPTGPEVLFPDGQVEAIVTVLREVNATATVA